jgi:glutamyl-tRNA synthetase
VKDDVSWMKAMKDGASDILDAAAAAFGALETWSAEALKAALERVGEERGLKLGKTQAPIRVAVTGRSVGLPLFESIEVLGRERTLARLAAARAQLTV